MYKNTERLIGNVVGPVDHWWCLQIREKFVVVFIQECMYARFLIFFLMLLLLVLHNLRGMKDVLLLSFIIIVINSNTVTVVMILTLASVFFVFKC